MSADLCYLSATRALEMFRTKALSPVELLDAQIKRTEAVNPAVNAVVMNYFDEAKEQARKAEQAYMNGGARILEGLTLAVKDEHNIAGKITTNGSLLLQSNVATYTDPICERTIEAGAIVHARTSTPEFSAHYATWSKLWGATRNPWNLKYHVGGSSGGSGAALASGMTTLATGSDIAGSIRMPAAQNGIVGFKPPHGRVPKFPPWNLVHYYSDGPMARTVQDTILLENVIAGPHRCDMNSLKPKLELPTSFDSIKGMRIAYSVDMGGKAIDATVRANTLEVIALLRNLGAQVNEVDIGWKEVDANEAGLTYIGYMFAGMLDLRFGEDPQFDELATSYVKHLVSIGKKITQKDFLRSLSYEAFMYDCVRRIFENHDLLICPTMSMASLHAEICYSNEQPLIDGRRETSPVGPGLTVYFNTLSRCPVLSVPSGFDENNVPTGIQIIGPTYEDASVFRLGLALEQAMPRLFDEAIRPAFA
ncbi:MAG TPA: amidase [Sphingobium sp.]|nr:amidase [Sphingobium sp.]